MALVHAKSGQVISVAPLRETLAESRSSAILKSEQLEIIRSILHAGKRVHEHQVPGELTLQCIEGKVEFSVGGRTQVMVPGDLVHLGPKVAHSLHALADSSMLLIFFRHSGHRDETAAEQASGTASSGVTSALLDENQQERITDPIEPGPEPRRSSVLT